MSDKLGLEMFNLKLSSFGEGFFLGEFIYI